MSDAEAVTLEHVAWRLLAERVSVVVLRVSRVGTILEANRHAQTLTGLPLVGQPLSAMLLEFARLPPLPDWLDAGDQPRILNVRTASGLPQTLWVIVEPIGEAFVLLGQVDAEEQERLRRAVLELNHELNNVSRELALRNAELAQLNALKNQFLGMAAHDLRKPAGLVLSYAELLAEQTGDLLTGEQREFIETIRASADRMRHVIDDFLDVSMIEAGRFSLDVQPADLEDLVRGALTLVRTAATKRKIQTESRLDPASRRLLADGSKIEQVLTNLLSNAVQHSPVGGTVRVLSERREASLRVCVTDEGGGVPSEQMPHLFQAFAGSRMSKPDGERSVGLGLAIARKIVEAHGGRVFVESEPGSGSVFGFTLPESCCGNAPAPPGPVTPGDKHGDDWEQELANGGVS
jgi:signal transduction histidine kinase